MRFGRPEMLPLLLILPLLAPFAVWSLRRRRRRLEGFGNPALVGRLVPAVPWEWQLVRWAVLAHAAAFLILAMAEPQWGSRMENLRRRGVDIVIALDTSASMLAQDVRPSRIERAKAEVSGFLRYLGADRVALVPFAGTGYVHCPMTSDYGAVRIFLDILEPGLIPVPGTAIGTAIRTSLKAFPDRHSRHQVILLLSDGEDHGTDPLGAAREAADQGVRIFTVGIGSGSGGRIPVRRPTGEISAFKTDGQGREVTTRLDEATLEQIAAITAGAYYRSTSGEVELETIAEAVQGIQKREYEDRSLLRLEHRYQIPLVVAVLFLSLELCLPRSLRRWSVRSRRSGVGRTAAAFGLVVALLATGEAEAGSAAGTVREGNRLYENGDFEAAMKKYTEAQVEVPDSAIVRFNLGNALYRLGKNEEAIEEYRRALSSPDTGLSQAAQYNIGNARFRMGRFEDAVRAYEQALRLDPDDFDSKRNLEIALLKLRRQEDENRGQDNRRPDAGDEPPPPAPRGGPGRDAQPPPPGSPERREPQAAGEDNRLSLEEALRLLEALEEGEKDSLRRGLRLPEPAPAQGEDW